MFFLHLVASKFTLKFLKNGHMNGCHVPNVWKLLGISPGELVELLNMLYSAFDETILDWGLHKVEPWSSARPLGHARPC